MFDTLHAIYGKEKEMSRTMKIWMVWISFILFIFYSWLLVEAGEDPFDSEGISQDAFLSGIVSANTRFGFKLYKELAERNGKSNIFVSPLSVTLALSMCRNGADGETQKVMAKALEHEGLSLSQVNEANAELMDTLLNPGTGVELNLATSLWADKDVVFKENFLQNNKEFYDAEIMNLDLGKESSLKIINRWISKNTQGRIGRMLDGADLDAIMFIINAVYFKGVWTVGFDEQNTEEKEFTSSDGDTKRVPMMMSQSDRYSYYRSDDFSAVELPYGDEKVSIYLFLPDTESSLQELHKNLNKENWESWMSGFQSELVRVVLPRVRLESEVLLNGVLEALGMGIAFRKDANFKKMCYGPAFIDWVKHKAFIDINEEGTEASAGTVVKMKKGGFVTLVFDRPFFFAIRDNVTGSILFMGSINNL